MYIDRTAVFRASEGLFQAPITEVLEVAAPQPLTRNQIIGTMRVQLIAIKDFVPQQQMRILTDACRSREPEEFAEIIARLHSIITSMPSIGGSDQQTAHLHYFYGRSDWYITERDCVAHEPQYQARGFACLNGDGDMAESGYISIEELRTMRAGLTGIELDFHFKPQALAPIVAKIKGETP